MRIMIPIIAALALAGCAGTREPGIDVRTVSVPTPVPCVKADEVPAEPEMVGDQLTGDAVQDLGILAPNALELRKAFRELLALVVPGCVIIDQPAGK